VELRHFRYFVAAAEAENVSRAATRLHVSQPALSRQIRDLEEELGFPLFERGAKSVRLTEAGKVFLTEVRAVLQRADEAVTTARATAVGGRTELQVGYAPSPTARIMPPTLRAFQARFPKVRVRLHDLSTDEMVTAVREGTLQLAILVHPNNALIRRLKFRELTRDAMCLAVPPTHAMARLGTARLADVARMPLLVLSRKEYPEYLEYLDELFSRVKARPTIAEEHDSASSLIAAIESGAGLAVVPESFSCSAGPRLKLLPISPAPEPIVIGALWSERYFTATAEEFWKCASAAAMELKNTAVEV
jgi:LysR family transcriptional regulator, benzoate and cis,cis-muconate-responsive activator of ben and cat genes